MYWGKAPALLLNLRFDLIDTYVSPDSVVVFYQNERGTQICEYLRLDAKGKDPAGFRQSSRALDFDRHPEERALARVSKGDSPSASASFEARCARTSG